jgi:uncharacterized protein
MIIQSQFTPASGLRNTHLQTLLPTFIRNNLKLEGIKETLELDDGDFLDLVWTEKPDRNKPIVIVFHGLEGSINSPYVMGVMLAIKNQGWSGLLMHFRGCSEKYNRLPRTYHSGETGDAKYLLSWLKKHYPESPLAAVGFSLGGNMLLKLQAELGESSPFKATVSVCAPMLLSDCADRLNMGFSKIYQAYLLRHLKTKVRVNAVRHNYKNLINFNVNNINQLKTFWQFDDLVTAPLHGFSGVDDYYAHSSARQYLNKIKTPGLILQALDDPFMTAAVIPRESELSSSTQLELSEHGGHVGFIGGTLLKPEFWLEKRIPEYLSEFI